MKKPRNAPPIHEVIAVIAVLGVTASPQGIADPGSQSVSRYAKFEISFQLPDVTGNPFDPDYNDVEAAFRLPDGSAVDVPAFWDGNDVWKVRYAPAELGVYRYNISRNGTLEHPGKIGAMTFRCVASRDHGFLRVDRHHTQAFAFDDGTPYYPLGSDQAWTPGDDTTETRTFGLMREAGMNWARTWMTAWDGKNLEWAPNRSQSPPLGQYLLDTARKWDAVIDNAAADGIYLQVTLQHHGQVTRVVDANWNDNPYNVANGGFLQNPQDYFTDPRAISLTRAKYRYIVARWGYSDHIMGWELFNEIQNDPEENAHFDTVIAWHQAMAAYLRQIDPNRHMITTSNSDIGNPLERAVSLDYDQVHAYVSDIVGLFNGVESTAGDRPWFYGEWGSSGDFRDPKKDAAFLHDGIWSGIMAPLAGGQQYWAWDAIDKNQWWPIYQSATAYVKRSGMAGTHDVKRESPTITCAALAGLSFAPQGGWATASTYDLTIPSTGAVPSLRGVPSFIQGAGHREMMTRPITFHVNGTRPCQFVLKIADIAASGAHPQLLLDGLPLADRDYTGTGRDRHNVGDILSIDVPAGPHTVGLYNTDHDWFTVDSLTLTNYVSALGIAAKGNANAIFFWAYNRDRPYRPAAAPGPITGTVAFSGLSGKTYDVYFWNVTEGRIEGTPQVIKAIGDAVSFPITISGSDIAGWIRAE